MEEKRKPRRQLNIVARTARTRRIFERLREGWSYDDIASAEHVTAERIRQIVTQVLEKRFDDRSENHARLQLERMRPALKLVGEAVKRGEISAVGPLIKLVDRLDRHRGVYLKNIYADEDYRQKLLDKLNFAAANLEAYQKDEELQAIAGEGQADAPDGGEGHGGPAGPADFFRSEAARK